MPHNGSSELALKVPSDVEDLRLDRFLSDALGESRSRVQRWIREGRVTVAGSSPKAGTLLGPGQTINIRLPRPGPEAGELVPESEPLSVLFADDSIVVLDKPAGLAVHPGAGRRQGTLANRLLSHFPTLGGWGDRERPGIVHRLDRETSGVMVVALTPESHRHLTRAFARRRVDKRYLGIAYGDPGPEPRQIDAPIGRHQHDRKRMTIRSDGRPAQTTIRRRRGAEGVSLLELQPRTGRTHQIRVHLKWAGHPLVGDPIYGEARWKALSNRGRGAARDFPRPALHAWRVEFAHPESGGRVCFAAPAPADLRELWRQLAGESWPELEAS